MGCQGSCEMRLFPREKGKTAFVEGFSLNRPFSLLAWEKSCLAGVENRGSLISAPLALREFQECPQQTKPKKGPKRKVHEFRPLLWFLVFFLRKQARFTLNVCSGMPLRKVHELTFGLVCRCHSWKLLHYIALLFRINFPDYVIMFYLHCRIGFELFPWLCLFLHYCKAYHVDIGLHYIIVFKLICQFSHLFLLYRIGFKLIL